MRPLAAALLATLLWAAPAAAQDAYKPVVGAGSFNSAPILEPGRYRDTVLPSEYLYYAVRMQPGQRLHLKGNVELSRRELIDLAVPATYLSIHSPTRVKVSPFGDGDNEESMDGTDSPDADFVGPEVEPLGDNERGGPWTGPGVYFVAVHPVYLGDKAEPPRAEIPFHFEIGLEGTPVARPKATPFPTATPKATATPASGGDDQGSGPALAAGVGVGALLIGVVAGIAMRRRRP